MVEWSTTTFNVVRSHSRMGCLVSSVLFVFSLGAYVNLRIAWKAQGNQVKFFPITSLHHKKSPFNKLQIYSSWTILCLFHNLFWAELFPCLPAVLKECYLVVSINFCFFPSTAAKSKVKSVSIVFSYEKLLYWLFLGYIVWVTLVVHENPIL